MNMIPVYNYNFFIFLNMTTSKALIFITLRFDTFKVPN